MDIKTIFFDIGNVLIFFSYEEMCQKIGNVCGLSPIEVHNHLLKDDLGIRYEKGLASTDEIYSSFLHVETKPHTREELTRSLTEIFYPNETIYPIVHALKEQKIRLILLSNTCEVHFRYITEHFPILSLFDGGVLSYKVNARKPEKEIFEEAIKRAECPPENCFYTDDIPAYINAAHTLGIDAETYQDATTLRAHLLDRDLMAE